MLLGWLFDGSSQASMISKFDSGPSLNQIITQMTQKSNGTHFLQ